jgi:hypothetical protein
MNTEETPRVAQPPRRWLTVEQIAQECPAFTAPAIRALIQRSRPHYNHRGERVEGNGLAAAICQPGGKNGKVMIDAVGFAQWLERWVSDATPANDFVQAA